MAINLAPLPNGIQLINTGLTPNDRQGDPLPVAFEKINQNMRIVLTRNEDSFAGPVTFQQTLTVMGPAVFNQTTTYNQQSTFNSSALFNNTVDFKQVSTFGAAAIFNEVVSFNRVVNFVHDALFGNPVTFNGIATFNGVVNLPAGTVRPDELDAVNAPADTLVLGYNAANGRFAWRAQTGGTGGTGGGITSVGIAEINAGGAAANRILRINPAGNGLIWSELGGSGGLASVTLGDIQATAAAPTRVLSVTPDGQSLIWVDVAEQQASSFQNLQQMILHHSEGIRTAGRNAAMIQNQLGLRVFNYNLPLGVAANVEGDVEPEEATSLDFFEPIALAPVTTHLSDAIGAQAYNQPIYLRGGKGPYNWAVVSELPEGLSLAPITQAAQNRIQGTPLVEGDFEIYARVTDSSEPPMETFVSIPLTVDAPPPGLAIITSDLTEVVAKQAFSLDIEALNGTGPFTWSLFAGSLPVGMTLDADAVGRVTKISGTPATAGDYTFTLEIAETATPANNATRTFTLTVAPEEVPELVILTPALLSRGMRNNPYSMTIAIQGGKAPFYWRVIAGALPAGLSLSASVSPEAEIDINGYATTAGDYEFTLQVTDSSPNPQQKTLACDLTMIIPPSDVTLVTSVLPVGFTQGVYVAELTSAGGEGLHTWTVSSGTLPAGISLQTSGGEIAYLSGTPTVPGTYTFSIRVTDVSATQSTQNYTLVLVDPVLNLEYSSYNRPPGSFLMNAAWLGLPYSQDFKFRPVHNAYYYTPTNTNWYSPNVQAVAPRNHTLYFYVNRGSIPAGMRWSKGHYGNHSVQPDSTQLTLSGTPTQLGVKNFSIYVRRGWEYLHRNGRWYTAYDYTTYDFTVTVNAAVVVGTPVFVTTALPQVIVGSAYSSIIRVAGGTDVVWQTINGVPSWAQVIRNGSELRIIGVAPAGLSLAQPYQVFVQALVNSQLVSRTYPIYLTA